MDDVGASTSGSSSHVCVPHSCIMCKNLCFGPLTDADTYQYVIDEEDIGDAATKAAKPHRASASHESAEEGYAEQSSHVDTVRVNIINKFVT